MRDAKGRKREEEEREERNGELGWEEGTRIEKQARKFGRTDKPNDSSMATLQSKLGTEEEYGKSGHEVVLEGREGKGIVGQKTTPIQPIEGVRPPNRSLKESQELANNPSRSTDPSVTGDGARKTGLHSEMAWKLGLFLKVDREFLSQCLRRDVQNTTDTRSSPRRDGSCVGSCQYRSEGCEWCPNEKHLECSEAARTSH